MPLQACITLLNLVGNKVSYRQAVNYLDRGEDMARRPDKSAAYNEIPIPRCVHGRIAQTVESTL